MKNYLALLFLLLSGCTGLHVENDIFGLGKNADKFYTHGTKFSNTSEEGDTKTSYAVGQNIYTPSSKKPDADLAILNKDRPYAGYLYGEYQEAKIIEDVQNTWGFQVGCVGPCSLAKETQQGFHKLIDQGIPEWQPAYTQRSEPVATLLLEQKRKQYSETYNEWLEGDASLYGQGKLGNLIDNASIGAELRLGYALPKFNPNEIVFRKSPDKEIDPWSIYGFTKAEQRYVAYNHLLDGSLWQTEKHTVDSKDFVSEGQFGLSVGYGAFNFAYSFVFVTDEWTTQDGGFAFGGLDFNW